MSAARFLLLFIARDEWLRVADGVVVARGQDFRALAPAAEDEFERVVLVVPGEDVLLQWIELPRLAPAQALAAARLLAAEVSATPVERLHVALGDDCAGDSRWIAIAEADRVAGWIEQARAIGFDPDHILPEPLLIPPRANVTLRWERDGLHLVRGEALAFAAEAAIVGSVAQGPIEAVDDATVEAGVGAVVATLPVDLRRGAFARRRRWRPDRARIWRLAGMAAAILIVTLLVQIATILRYNADTARLEAGTRAIARAVLPGAGQVADPRAELSARLDDLRGGGLGYGTMAGLLFAAVRDTPDVELGSLRFDRDGTLAATASTADAAALAALERRIEEQGLGVESGAVRTGGGRQIAELVVRPL